MVTEMQPVVDQYNKEAFEKSLNEATENYKKKFASVNALDVFDSYMVNLLIKDAESVHPAKAKNKAISELFERFNDIDLIDKYKAYGVLDEVWNKISNDIELIQDSSISTSCRAVDPNMILKKKDGKDVEVQDGNKGRIFPFELIQEEILKDDKNKLNFLESRQVEIEEELTSIVETLSEEDGEYVVLNDANDKFLVTNTRTVFNELFEDIEIEELNTLRAFRELPNRKKERTQFMEVHPEIKWNEMTLKKDGTPSVTGLNDYEKQVQANYAFEEDSFGYKLSKAMDLMDEDKEIKSGIKGLEKKFVEETEKIIKTLTNEQIEELLYVKWIEPSLEGIHSLGDKLIKDIELKIMNLHDKYSTTMVDIQEKIKESNNELINMMNSLVADESDMTGIKKFQELLGGGSDE